MHRVMTQSSWSDGRADSERRPARRVQSVCAVVAAIAAAALTTAAYSAAGTAHFRQPPIVASGDRPGWGMPVWRDEFDGDSVDPSKWRVRDGTRLAYDEAVIDKEKVSMQDGYLRITTSRLEVPVTGTERLRSFATGYVDSIGRFSQRYGRWEVRARLPLTPGASRGVWPAFWLRDSEGAGEIDVFEAIGDPHEQLHVHPAGIYSMTVHESTNHEPGTTKIEYKPDHVVVDDGAFHTWALEWEPDGMRFYFDGELMWAPTAEEHPWLRASFTEAGVNIRINTQVGHEWMGYTDRDRPWLTRMPVHYDIDYVRVWKHGG